MEEETQELNQKEPTCTRCGLRSYNDSCQNCGSPIVNKKDEEDEEYDWRETKR